MKNYNLDVETIQAGQSRPYADSIYHFIITDKSEKPLSKYVIRQFCINMLQKGYSKEDMPNPFAGQIIVFKQREDGKWEYKVRCLFTG